jgi:hypothetical protein
MLSRFLSLRRASALEKDFEPFLTRQTVQQSASAFWIHVSSNQATSNPAQSKDPIGVFGSELLFEFSAQALGQRGAVARG